MGKKILNEIPTAEEFLIKHNWTKDSEEMLREFAKLHVKSALEAAYEEASNSDLNTEQLDKIFNAYTEENII